MGVWVGWGIVFSEGNDFCVQKIKLFFVLIKISIRKDTWLKLSQNKNSIFAVIDTGILESPPSKDLFARISLS